MVAVTANSMVRELIGHSALVIKQRRKGCFQECCGCEATSHFRVSDADDPREYRFYLTERSSCLWRFCCPSVRPWRTELSLGGEPGGDELVLYDRPLRCNPAPCKCCCYQAVSARDARTGAYLGGVHEMMYCCVPKLAVADASGATTHYLRQPTCCWGSCVNWCDRHGGGCCKVPYYLYATRSSDAGGRHEIAGEPVGRVVKTWGGLAGEFLTDADTFQLSAPADASSEQIAVLIGATLLVNQLFFESAADAKDKAETGGGAESMH
jgi:hypothetical protein